MITITNQADLEKFVTSKDPVLYEIETDTAPDRVLCEVLDEAGTVLASVTHKPLFGETDKFSFDVSGLIDDLIGTDMYVNASDVPLSTGFLNAPNSHLAFQCRFTTIFDDDSDSDSDSDAGESITETDLRVAIAAIFEPLDDARMTDRYLDEQESDGTEHKTLTNFEKVKRVRLIDSLYEMVLFDTGAIPTLSWVLTKINKDGSTDNRTFDLPFATDSDGDDNYSYTIHIGMGPADINKALNEDFIDEDVKYYQLQILTGTSPSYTGISETRKYYLIDDCRPKSLRLHFLNRLGGFDSFLFLGQTKRGFETTSKEFQSNLIESKSDIRQDDTYKVYSDYLNDNEALVLREMLASSEVYMEVGTEYIQAIVETKKLQVADSLNGLIKYEIDFHIAEKTKAQRR